MFLCFMPEQVTSHLRTTLTSRQHARISAPVISRSNNIKQGTTNTKVYYVITMTH